MKAKKKIITLLFLIYCFIMLPVLGQDPKREINTNRLSLKDCVDLAILGNYAFKAQRENLLEAIANVRVKHNLSQPSVSFSATNGQNSTGQKTTARSLTFNLLQDINTGDQIVLVNNAYTQNGYGQNLIYNQFSVQYTKPLLKNGGLAAGNYNIATSDKTLQESNLDYEVARQDLIKSVITAYYNVIKAKNIILIYEGSVRAAEEAYKTAVERNEKKLAEQIDITRAEVLLVSSQNSLVEAKKNRKTYIDALAVLIGFTPEDNIDIKYDYSRKFNAYDMPVENLIKEAMDKRLELARKNVELDQTYLNLNYYKNQFMPDLNLVTSYNTNPNSSLYGLSQSYLLPSWSINLNSTYYFRNFQDEENMKQARRLVDLKKEEISNYKNVITDQVRGGARDVSSSISQIEISAKNVQVSEETFSLAIKRWEDGKADNRDVMDAQKDINSAKISYYNAQIDYLNSKAKLLRYIGENLYKYLGKDF